MWRAESWSWCLRRGVLLWSSKFVVGLWIKANHNQSSILKFPHKKSSRPVECKCFMLCVGVGTWGWRPREPVERLQRARCCRNTFEMMCLVWMDDLCLLSDHPLVMPALQSPHCTSISPLCSVFSDLQLPLLFSSPSSLSIAPRLFLSLPLFLRLFFLAGEQVVLIPVTLHIFPSVSLWESILGSAVYRRCSLEALC